MLKKVMMVLMPMLLIALFNGCSQKPLVQTQIQKVKITVPGKYLEDKSLPAVPVATMQSETSSYMVDLFYFAVECKEDKRAIKNILENKGVSNE